MNCKRLVVAQVGHQHVAAFERAPRPVAEAAAAVARADDQAGANDQACSPNTFSTSASQAAFCGP
jgi:hypothetical protein